MSFVQHRGRLAAIRLARHLCIAIGFCALAAQAQFLDAATQQKIRAATFEVVMLKPVDDPLTYEKPLPLELLPFQFRNDKYFSVGTAFAMGNHRFATAAHVFGLGIASQWGAPALRDGNGKVYQIDKVLKYSTAQDFAVFSVVDEPQVQPLDIGPHPTLNEPVYAVGNALGEGVVIRDGLYTSDTPEERDGKWKWLRFSAAASPGNSGGPLLDKDGKVIGVVLRKSPSENLNYALAIDELVNAKDNTALVDSRVTYQLDVFDYKQTESIKKEFALPKNYADFTKAYTGIWYAFEDQLLQDLLKNNADGIFPRGSGATELLHTIQIGDSPGLVMKSEDGNWSVHRSAEAGHSDLGHNGYVTTGRLGNSVAMRLRRPDDMPADKFYADSRLFIDTLLKGTPLHRSIGTENIKITSMGKAREDSIFVDTYQRKWQLRQWPMPFEDIVVVTLSLPVPEGYVVLVRPIRTSQVHESVNDLEAIANFVAVAYGGTLAQWQDYRKQTALLPSALDDIDISFDYGKSLSYSSPRLAFSYTTELQKITAGSELYLDFSYFNDHGHTVWDVARIKANEDAHNEAFVSIARNIEPADSMNGESKSRWSKLTRRQHPYDAVVSNDGDLSMIHGVREPESKAAAGDSAVLYTVMVQNDGVATQDAMKGKLDQAMHDLSAKDDLAPKASAGDAQD
jgi:serine protease Do